MNNDKKLLESLALLGKGIEDYLRMEKVFIPNPERFAEVVAAKRIAEKLFSDFKIEVTNDPLQTGALVIKIKGCYIECSGTEVKDFQSLIKAADNFEIFPTAREKFEFTLMFYGALKRI